MAVSTARSDWVTKQRAAANALILACQNILALDEEYVANGYGAALVLGDLTGANTGLLVADITTAETNLTKVANAVLGLGSFPVSIVTGTNSTIFAIK